LPGLCEINSAIETGPGTVSAPSIQLWACSPKERLHPSARVGILRTDMPLHHNEAFSRVLIDRALDDSDWALLNSMQVEFEFHTVSGRADYLLKDKLGRVFCVLEAKRADADPYDAKEQARGYADNLNAPFVILSNGREHWFWNLQRAKEQDAYRIERLPSQDDLERVRLKNLQPSRPLPTKEAIICDTVDSIAARFNLRYSEQKWLNATAELVADDPQALAQFTARDAVFEALRQTSLVRQSAITATAGQH